MSCMETVQLVSVVVGMNVKVNMARDFEMYGKHVIKDYQTVKADF